MAQISVVWFFLISFFQFTLSSYAFDFLPDSHKSVTRTQSEFTGDEASVYKLSGRAYWMSVGGDLSLIRFLNGGLPVTVSFFGFAKSWMETRPGSLMFLPQTIDAYLGFNVNYEVDDLSRWVFGIHHISGHAADEIYDKTFLMGNAGLERLMVRYVRDSSSQQIRWFASFKPVVSSDPHLKWFSSDVGLDYFPYETGLHKPSFFVATYLEETGKNTPRINWHIQTGFYWGNRIRSERSTDLKLVLGFYAGFDPRIKYFMFSEKRTSFPYFGLATHF